MSGRHPNSDELARKISAAAVAAVRDAQLWPITPWRAVNVAAAAALREIEAVLNDWTDEDYCASDALDVVADAADAIAAWNNEGKVVTERPRIEVIAQRLAEYDGHTWRQDPEDETVAHANVDYYIQRARVALNAMEAATQGIDAPSVERLWTGGST
jgi:hypothetical protein